MLEGEGVPLRVGLHSKVTQIGSFIHGAMFPSKAPALKGSAFPNRSRVKTVFKHASQWGHFTFSHHTTHA